ncbi:MAG: terminase gpA endonuclease subunit [Akkermansiaceae bacterium]
MSGSITCAMSDWVDKVQIQDPVAWAEKNLQLDYGNFKRENHPLMADPLRMATEKHGGYVGLIGSVQAVKTLTAQVFQLYGMHVSPANSAHYDLTQDALKELSDDKLVPLIENTDCVMRLIPNQAYRKTKMFTGTPYGFLRLLSAGVLANRNSKTLERITADESWAYKDDEGWLEQIHDRQSSFPWQWQMFLPSSGQTAGTQLDSLWSKSTQRTWHVRCDCCGEEIPYIWKLPPVNGKVPPGGIRYAASEEVMSDEGMIDWVKLRESVYYQCQLCEGRMDWSPADQDRRNQAGRYIRMNFDSDPDIEMFHYNALAHVPWPELVTKWKEATIARSRGDLSKLENFVRKQLAQAWNESEYMSDEIQESARGNYLLGDKWNTGGDDPLLFLTCDVQKDHYYVVVRAWAIVNGVLQSRLIEREKVVSVGQIRDLADKHGLMQNGIRGSRVFMDGNYNTGQVQRIAAENGWMVFRGDKAQDFRHKDGLRRIYSDMQYIDIGEGTSSPRSRYVGQIRFSKHAALNRLSLIRSIRSTDDKPVWTYADNAGAVYERQINAWHRISKTAPDGKRYYDFVNRDSKDDHYGDCEQQQVVCAAMAGLVGVSSTEEIEEAQTN